MSAPASFSDVLRLLGAAQRIPMQWVSVTTVAQSFFSQWRVAGQPGPAPLPPAGAGEIPTIASSGATPIVNAAAGRRLYLAGFGLAAHQQVGVTVYDRLWHNSGLSGTSVATQTINSPSVNRPDGTGEGVELWMEVNTGIGNTIQNATASYTNSQGVAGRSATISLGGASIKEIGRMARFQLQAGDSGVRSVQNIILAGSTGTAGDFGLVLLSRLLDCPLASGDNYRNVDATATGLPPIPANACLACMTLAATTTTGFMSCELVVVES